MAKNPVPKNRQTVKKQTNSQETERQPRNRQTVKKQTNSRETQLAKDKAITKKQAD